MAPDMRSKLIMAAGVLGLGALACNAAIGFGTAAVVGTAGYFAAECYDRVRVRVRDAATGLHTCEAEVTAMEGDSETELRSCYYASLTEGVWFVTARREGYVPSSTEIHIPEHEGSCPRYTHSVELTLWPLGSAPGPALHTEASPASPAAPSSSPAPAAAPSTAPAPVPSAAPAPAPGAAPAPAPASPTSPTPPPPAPAVPTRSFETVPPAEPAPADAGTSP